MKMDMDNLSGKRDGGLAAPEKEKKGKGGMELQDSEAAAMALKSGNGAWFVNPCFKVALLLVLSVLLLSGKCSHASKPRKKQIILISIDTLRGDHLNSFGYFRETAPNLSKLIEDSLYFRDAYPNGCWTMPSHVSLLTGTLPSRHGVNKDWKSIKDWKAAKPNRALHFLAEILKSNKFRTIKFAQLPKALGFARGFDINMRFDPFATNRKFHGVLQEIERHKGTDFLFFIHTWMVHSPYSNSHFLKKKAIDRKKRYYIDHFRVLKNKSNNGVAEFKNFLVENKLFNREDCVALYDSGIRYVDRYIGKIIEKTKQLGIYKDLMFIVVSDHGEHFSEHFPDIFYSFHGKDFYEEFIKVPLIIKYPGNKMTGAREDPVSLMDVVPTILDYYHMDIPAFVQGESLLNNPSKSSKKYLVAEAISESAMEMKMIRLGNLKYIITMREPSGTTRTNWLAVDQRRLFDLKNDPGETRNLFEDLKYRNLCKTLEKTLQKIIQDSGNGRWVADRAEVSAETLEQMKALGYL